MPSEVVPFRLIQCPVCNTLLCWVNSRLPSYCPEGGHFIYDTVRGGVLVRDDNATLKYTTILANEKNPPMFKEPSDGLVD